MKKIEVKVWTPEGESRRVMKLFKKGKAEIVERKLIHQPDEEDLFHNGWMLRANMSTRRFRKISPKLLKIADVEVTV